MKIQMQRNIQTNPETKPIVIPMAIGSPLSIVNLKSLLDVLDVEKA